MLHTLRSSLRAAFSETGRRGFTLIEIAIVLVVIGLIVSGGLLAVSPVLQSAKITETRQKMATIESALLGYVIANGCLPCPAARNIGGTITGIANDGSDYTTACGSDGTCLGATNNASGLVPWVTLGISENDATDGWGRLFSYGADSTLTNSSTDVQRTSGTFPTFTSNIQMNSTGGTNLGYTAIAYVIVSHGLDGSFGETFQAQALADKYGSAANSGQNENGDSDLTFVTGNTIGSNNSSYYDDLTSFKSLQPLIISCGAGSCGNPS
ncbi:MAG: prepilin-type N-terminal cleavage/methylation domain-containing protein [Rhodospirillaceae bacterium]|nr:prepilin-type N-terminal cleavage/methylation domain-containing protein [Rhodospirillaceae bacterium]